ncbi:MAG: hypothetical protein WAL56_11390 [Candidatus Sulfotelmatobacter sp.]
MSSRFRFFLLSGTILVMVHADLAQQAAAGAGKPSSSSSSVYARKLTPTADSRLDAGSLSNGMYRSPTLGFSCKIPAGWVLRTEEMNTRDEQAAPDADKSGRVLLAAFSRPPAAHGEDINSSILIAAESVAAYPGLKEAVQYFDPVTEIAKAQGFEVDGDPYEFEVGVKTMVRGDFQKDIGTRVMRQATLVILVRGYGVSFTFIGGTEDEVEELIEGLSFGAGTKPHPR